MHDSAYRRAVKLVRRDIRDADYTTSELAEVVGRHQAWIEQLTEDSANGTGAPTLADLVRLAVAAETAGRALGITTVGEVTRSGRP